MIKIPLNSVKYFESNSRMVLIHMLQTDADGRVRAVTKKFYGKIKDVEKTLADSVSHYFIRIHQSYLINYDYVALFNYASEALMHRLGSMLMYRPDRIL